LKDIIRQTIRETLINLGEKRVPWCQGTRDCTSGIEVLLGKSKHGVDKNSHHPQIVEKRESKPAEARRHEWFDMCKGTSHFSRERGKTQGEGGGLVIFKCNNESVTNSGTS